MIAKFIAFLINAALLFTAVVGFPLLTLFVQGMQLWEQGVIVVSVIFAFIALAILADFIQFSAQNWKLVKFLHRHKIST